LRLKEELNKDDFHTLVGIRIGLSEA